MSSATETGSDSPHRGLWIRVHPGETDPIRQVLAQTTDPRMPPVLRLKWEGPRSPAAGMQRLQDDRFDAVLLEFADLHGAASTTLCEVLRAAGGVPVVVVTGAYDHTFAIEALNLGAQDCIPAAELTPILLGRSARHARERHRTRWSLQQRLEQVHASEQRLRHIIEKDADGIVIVNRDGDVLYANPAARALFQRGESELIGEPFGFPLVPDDVTEIEIVRKNAAHRTAEMRLVKIIWEGTPAYLASLHDVTEWKHAQQLAHSRREDMKEFLHIVAHDLQHPLVSIMWQLGALEEECGHQLQSDQHEYLKTSLAECVRMKQLIEELGRLAQIEQAEVVPERVSLQQLMQAAVARFGHRIADQGVELVVDCPDVAMLLPRNQLEQSLDNLINNALNYGCTSRHPRIKVIAVLSGRRLSISVEDNGHGIAPSDHERIFKLFHRLNPNAAVHGSGIGLTAVQRMMKLVGGVVKLHSRPGEGARFTITLPVDISC